MRLKLDENLPARLPAAVAEAGHDVATVAGEDLLGCEDERLYDVCREEGRVLVTLDLDFANPLRFPPETGAGIIVLRPRRPLLSILPSMLLNALTIIEAGPSRGRLWIVEPARIRVHESPDDPLGA